MHIFTANLHICFYIQTEFTSKTTIHQPTNHPPCWRWTRNRQKSACSAAWLGNAVRHDRAHYLATWPARPWRTPSHLERLTTTTLPTTRLPKRTPSWTPKAVRLVMSQRRRQRNSHSTYLCFFFVMFTQFGKTVTGSGYIALYMWYVDVRCRHLLPAKTMRYFWTCGVYLIKARLRNRV